MTDFVIGVMTDYTPKDIEPWVVSLCNSGFTGQKVMVTYNLPKETREVLENLGFNIWAVGREPNDGGFLYKPKHEFNICVDRFRDIPMFLDKLTTEKDRIVITDVKDVIFQDNPFKRLDEVREMEEQIYLSSESVTYENEPWGKNNLIKSFGEATYNKLANEEIWNAGVIAGRGQIFREFLTSIYMACGGKPNYIQGGGGPDQAALNVLTNFDVWEQKTLYFKDTKSWACQAGTTNDPTKNLNLTIDAKPVFDDYTYRSQITYKVVDRINKWVRPAMMTTRYCIVHQYDRVPEWNAEIKEKYTYNNLIVPVSVEGIK